MWIRGLCVAVLLMSAGPVPMAGARPTQARQERASVGEAYFAFLQGRYLEGEGDIEGAIKAYQRAIALDPSSGEVRAELASLYARQNRAQEAITAAEAALAVNPDNTEAHWVLGTVYAAMLRTREDGPRGGQAQAPAQAQPPELDKAIVHLEKARGARRYDLGLAVTLGRLYLRKPDYPKAIAAFTTLRQQEPGLTEAAWLLAQAYQGTGQNADAIRTLEEVVAEQPDFYRGLLSLAEMYDQERQWTKAAAAYARAAEQNPRFAELRVRQATALLNAGQPAAARDILREVVRERPTEAGVLYSLSDAEREAGDLEAAEAAARRLAALEPSGLRGPYLLARVFERRHDAAQVVATLQPAVERASARTPGASRQLSTVLAHLGFAYRDLGSFDRARTAFEQAKAAAGDDPSIDLYIAQTYLDAGDTSQALEVVRRARATRPDDGRLARLEADALRRGGRPDEGIALLRSEVSRHPDRMEGYLALANALGEASKVDDAQRVLDEAEGRFAREVATAFQRGVVFERNKRYADAEQAFKEALARQPDHGPTLNYLGYMLADRGERLDEAAAFVERALKTDPYNPSYLDSLGWTYFKQGDLARARTNIERAARALPRNSVVHDHLGDVLIKLGERDGAVAAWEQALAGDGESIDREVIARKIADARARPR